MITHLPQQDYTTSSALVELRFVKKDGRSILQQAYKVMTWTPKDAISPICTNIRVEWRDVPLVEDVS